MSPHLPKHASEKEVTQPVLAPGKGDAINGNQIVISGMSGLYSKSSNIKELSELLYNKINPITAADLRFKSNHPEVIQYTGSVPDLNRFDAQFLKVHYRLAMTMDPMGRKVLEQAYQAIYDAGINPGQLSGKKIGVYVGICFSESEKVGFYDSAARSGFGMIGKAMFANRISYWLNAKGPSMSIDDACCSSTVALEQAFLAISRGECEAALVCGTYLCLHPQSSVHYGRLIKMCRDGKTKSFDEHADGCARSEAINVLFLQKAKDANRIYADVLHVKTEFTCMLKERTGPKYGFYRNLNSTTEFINKFYKDADVPPQAVEYMEAFGSALPEVDKVELQAFEEVLCKKRKDTLLVGSVISNIGYAEASAGISGIIKVLLGYHNGVLAANLHYKHPRKDILALRDGRMSVVDEHQPFQRTYAAVNGMSVTGVNSHVLLHGHYKPKDLSQYKSRIPRLVNISGGHEEAVKYALDILKSNPIDAEQLALLHNIHRTSVSGHMGRGFVILQENEEKQTQTLCEKAEYFDDSRRPLWFVYSGMGSQWTSMGAQLMRIPIFAAAIERCQNALRSKRFDIVHIITSPDETIFSNILNSFVGIAAVQIGLTDILHELGLRPDGIIVPGMEGHHERCRVLCERLKLPAIVLQPGLDHAHETVRQTAERLAETLLKKTGLKESFYLLGYESGVSVALEIAGCLEEHGLNGTVYCVGFLPDEFQRELENHLIKFKTEEQLQDGVLRHMYTLMAGDDTTGMESLQQSLSTLRTWSQKADACVRALLGRVSHSAQYARALFESALGRIEQARRYRAAVRPLNSQLVLLRAATPHTPALQQHSRRPLVVHQLRAPLAHAAMDLHCAAIINQHLDPSILDSFAARNGCDSYLLNANSFLAVEK